MHELLARDLMVADVVTVLPETSIVDAARLMLERCVSALPVVDKEGLLVGIVSEGDLLRRVEIGTEHSSMRDNSAWRVEAELLREYRKSHGRRVADVMTTRVATVLANTALPEIAALLELMRLKRIPVTEHGKVIGIVSRTDLLRLLVREAEPRRVKGSSRDSDDLVQLEGCAASA